MVSETDFYVATRTIGILGRNIPIRPSSRTFLLLAAASAKPTLTRTSRNAARCMIINVLLGFGIVLGLNLVCPNKKASEE